MRKLAAACALAALTLAAGCGSDDPDSGSAAAPATSEEATQSPAGAAPGSSDAAGGATTLIGTVGSADNPNAPVITLTDADGQEVTSLPAGEYTIEVQDLSTVHNFHLVGGEVDETTAVPEAVDTTFEVTLEAGDYTFKCDPHPNMTGSFTVT
jgi:plastocyanin